MKSAGHAIDMHAEIWQPGKKGPTAVCTCGAQFTVEGDTSSETAEAFRLLAKHIREENEGVSPR